MNGAQLQAWFQANKKPVLAVAGVGAAGLGLMAARRKNATAGGEPGPGSGVGTALASSPAIAGTVPADAGGSYDSYSDLQNQITKLYDQVEQSQSPIPLPVQDKAAAAKSFTPGYYKAAGDTHVYYQDASGNLDYINRQEGDALKRAAGKTPLKINIVSKDSTFWQKRTFLDKAGTAPKTPGR